MAEDDASESHEQATQLWPAMLAMQQSQFALQQNQMQDRAETAAVRLALAEHAATAAARMDGFERLLTERREADEAHWAKQEQFNSDLLGHLGGLERVGGVIVTKLTHQEHRLGWLGEMASADAREANRPLVVSLILLAAGVAATRLGNDTTRWGSIFIGLCCALLFAYYIWDQTQKLRATRRRERLAHVGQGPQTGGGGAL